MLSAEEERFINYWQGNRLKEKKLFRQLIIGLPIGFLFVAPIILSFTSGWHLQANAWARGHSMENTPGVIIVAALLILVFVAIFSKRYRWEMNEQTFLEIQARENREKDAVPAAKEPE